MNAEDTVKTNVQILNNINIQRFILGMLMRLKSLFLDPGKGISRLPRTTARQHAYCERDNCHLSLRACYVDRLLLHGGRGPHTRRTDTDAAKQDSGVSKR